MREIADPVAGQVSDAGPEVPLHQALGDTAVLDEHARAVEVGTRGLRLARAQVRTLRPGHPRPRLLARGAGIGVGVDAEEDITDPALQLLAPGNLADGGP